MVTFNSATITLQTLANYYFAQPTCREMYFLKNTSSEVKKKFGSAVYCHFVLCNH